MGPAACRQRTPRWPRPSRRSCRGMPWRAAPGSTTSSRTTAMHLPVCFHLGFCNIISNKVQIRPPVHTGHSHAAFHGRTVGAALRCLGGWTCSKLGFPQGRRSPQTTCTCRSSVGSTEPRSTHNHQRKLSLPACSQHVRAAAAKAAEVKAMLSPSLHQVLE